jgi:hypothetical protein
MVCRSTEQGGARQTLHPSSSSAFQNFLVYVFSLKTKRIPIPLLLELYNILLGLLIPLHLLFIVSAAPELVQPSQGERKKP